MRHKQIKVPRVLKYCGLNTSIYYLLLLHTNYSWVLWGEEEKSAYVSEKFKSYASSNIQGEVHPNILLPELPHFLQFLTLHELSKVVN